MISVPVGLINVRLRYYAYVEARRGRPGLWYDLRK